MPRRRVAVALLLPHELSRQVRALRRVLGDPRLDDVPPHLTLVPPVNLHDTEVTELRRVLRGVSTRSAPFDLTLGPTATFAPATPTLHLQVSGEVDTLRALRDRVKVAPVDRPDEWPFSPHVTLRESMPAAVLDGALEALASEMGEWSVDRVHLLEQFRDEHGRRWRPVAEEPFGGPDVVGRGGVELVLRTVQMLEPEVSDLLGHTSVDHDGHTLVVAAELPGRAGEPIAAVRGAAGPHGAVLTAVHVDPQHQGMGVARQIVARWSVEAARRGADMAIADPEVADGALTAWGFSRVGTQLVRQLSHTRAE